jgi:hypothetical protein
MASSYWLAARVYEGSNSCAHNLPYGMFQHFSLVVIPPLPSFLIYSLIARKTHHCNSIVSTSHVRERERERERESIISLEEQIFDYSFDLGW